MCYIKSIKDWEEILTSDLYVDYALENVDNVNVVE